MDQIQAAKELTERARLGDQVAMSIIVGVRESAKKGNPRAKLAFKHLKNYIKKNPPNKSSFGSLKPVIPEQSAIDMCLAIALANGASLLGPNNPRISAMVESFEMPEQKAAFTVGMSGQIGTVPPVLLGVAYKGSITSLAIRLQDVRGTGKLSLISPMMGWEFGE